jgi:hypothetical protein
MRYRLPIFLLLFVSLFIVPATAIEYIVYTGEHFDTSASGNGQPYGITMNDSYFWITDAADDKVYQYYINGTYTGVNWATSGYPFGITMNESYFWITDSSAAQVYQYYINGTSTGVNWDTAASGNGQPDGIAMNDSYFWITDFIDDEVYKYYHNGTYISSWDTAASGNIQPTGITTDLTYLWTINWMSNDKVYKYYYNGTYTGESWSASASGDPSGIVTNNGYFYITDATEDEVYIYFNNRLPSIPTIISPSNNSVHTSSLPITLNVSSTDADSHTITYYFYGGTSPLTMSFLGNNDSVGGNSFNWSISQYDVYYWTARAYDGYEYSSNMTTAQFTLITPTNLTSPSNTSTIYTTYPPLTYNTVFTWQNTGAPSYRLVVAEDANFNIIKVDTTIGTSTSTHSLVVNEQYFWKVYSYDGSIFSDSSDIYSFNLTGNSTLTGSAIEGSIYHNADGYTLISGAEVIIWNATWSDSAITGSNGYYVFEGLTSGQVYSLQAKADRYLDSSVAVITAGTDPITKNFYLLDDLTDTEWWHYVKFTVQTIWGTKYPGVTTTVYEGSSVTPYSIGSTGSDGSITFHLNQNVQYRITFINSTAGISETRTLYPKDSHYYVIISSVLDSWDTYTVPISDAINFTISKSEINATHAYINVSYNDSLAETTDLKVYLNQTSDSDYFNQTNLDTWNGGAISSGSHSFIVSNYVGQSYLIHLVATHTTYGVIDSTYSIGFKGEIADKFPGIPASVWLYGSVFILLFTGGIFVNSNVEKGMLIVCIMFFIFYGLGAFGSLPSNVQYSMLAGGILGFIVSLIANLNKSNRDEGFN